MKKERKEKEKKEKVQWKWKCCLYFVYECFFYDKIAKNKEEFNILICSR
jgi:hypothetical protein